MAERETEPLLVESSEASPQLLSQETSSRSTSAKLVADSRLNVSERFMHPKPYGIRVDWLIVIALGF